MKIQSFIAAERGKADFGWLKANYAFSFANYYDPKKLGFGKLKVLNDDVISGGYGFGMHPHANMEIVTIPFEGGLKHEDNQGNKGVINAGEVQVMSAGTGIYHSEMNASKTEDAKTLQVWIEPARNNVKPRYDQRKYDAKEYKNRMHLLVGPEEAEHNALFIYQNAWFWRGQYDQKETFSYNLKGVQAGVYAFVLKGKVQVGEQILLDRDAAGITETASIDFIIEAGTDLLLIETAMN